jgi:2-oxoglutarate ferredoxin oxidoreductase subunit gamma
MSQEAYKVFSPGMNERGLLLIDEDLVILEGAHPPGVRILSIPATRLAEELGKKIVANIVMLGFLTAVGGVVSYDAMEKSIRSSVPPPTIDLNMKAFTMGLEYGRKLAVEGARA